MTSLKENLMYHNVIQCFKAMAATVTGAVHDMETFREGKEMGPCLRVLLHMNSLWLVMRSH